MVRALSVLFVALLTAAFWWLPSAHPARLAAIEIGQLLHEVPSAEPSLERTDDRTGLREAAAGLFADGGSEADEEETPRTLGEIVLTGKHTYERTEDSLKFSLFGARMTMKDADETVATELPYQMRRSLTQGLRQAASAGAADETGEGRKMSVLIPGQDSPQVGGASFLGHFGDGVLWLEYQPQGEEPIRVTRRFDPPRKLSLLPPLIAIVLAIFLRKPVIALLLGVLAGAFLVRQELGAGALSSLWLGAVDTINVYFGSELFDSWRLQTVGFVIFMLAMVGVITKNGGLRGLMELIAKRATNSRNTQVATFGMGLAVFFDDYANTILVGSTMRPLTDRFRIAREKLAYIVDSTAAPVAGISIFSTWIAYEVSTFSAQLPAAGLSVDEGYRVFIQTLPYRFYCIFAIAMVALVTLSGRDFGPMLKAERRAREKGELVRPGAKPMVGDQATRLEPAPGALPRASRALIPLLVFIAVTLFEIVRTGGGFDLPLSEWTTLEGFTGILGDGGGVWPLFVGSLSGFVVAVLMTVAMGLGEHVVGAAWTTVRSMFVAVLILYLAWMIGRVCGDLGTASYLTEVLGDRIHFGLLPIILFLLSALVAFSTGSSWSTMGILLPLVVGLSFTIGDTADRFELGPDFVTGEFLMILSIGAVLEGAIFGDHCSPISDTTVLSSIAAASDHIDHVRTQAPYAIATMGIAIVAGYFPCAFMGTSPFIGWAIGLLLLVVLLFVTGKRADAPAR